MIPPPPKSAAREVLSLRLDRTEREELDRACELLARAWGKPRVSKGDTLRAALRSFLHELEARTAKAESGLDTRE